MTLNFINSKWQDITRDERFICSHLYHSIINREKEFIEWLNNNTILKLNLNSNWEVGYEVCFYRDLIHYWKTQGKTIPIDITYSPKRTFDICMLSNDHIVIIEAKAQQGFHGDQLKDFEDDRKDIKSLLATQGFEMGVDIVLLHSSHYTPKNTLPKVTWKELDNSFCKNNLFLKADQLYGN